MINLLILAAAAAVAPAEPAPINPVTDAYPTISPDGRRMVFQSNRLGRGALNFDEAALHPRSAVRLVLRGSPAAGDTCVRCLA